MVKRPNSKGYELINQSNKNKNIQNIAQKEIKKSNNPLGIDFEVPVYTMFRAVRLRRRKHKPDKLDFLKTYRGFGHKFETPVIHTTNHHFIVTADKSYV